MKYTEFMRGAKTTTPDGVVDGYVKKIEGLESEVAALTEQLEHTDKEPSVVQYTNIRAEAEVAEIVQMLVEFGKKYFDDIPLTSVPGPMLQNLPGSLVHAIQYIHDHQFPDAFSPIAMLYLCCVEKPEEVIGRYLEHLGELMDDNAQAIHEDAEEYLRMLAGEDDEEDDDEDDYDDEEEPDESDDLEEPVDEDDAKYVGNLDAYTDIDGNRDVPDADDYPEIDPDDVDVIVDEDYEVVAINPAQEDGEIPYDE